MTLTLLPLYLKTIIKHQIDPSVLCTFYDSFYTILDAHHFRTKILTKANYHAVLKDSQNYISEA